MKRKMMKKNEKKKFLSTISHSYMYIHIYSFSNREWPRTSLFLTMKGNVCGERLSINGLTMKNEIQLDQKLMAEASHAEQVTVQIDLIDAHDIKILNPSK